MSKEPLGFIGLGNMGTPMVRNLMRGGHPLTVYNRTAAKAEPLVQEGAKQVSSPAAVAGAARTVLLCVADSPDVEQVVTGPNGLLGSLPRGGMIIDCSTISPKLTRTLAAKCAEQGIEFVDAPLTGGTKGAVEGTLTLMVGGTKEAFSRARPILELLGSNIVYMGPSGNGQYTKIINNLISGAYLAGICEGLTVAAKAGLPIPELLSVLGGGTAASNLLKNRVPAMVNRSFVPPGFSVRHRLKDFRLALEVAQELGVFTPVTSLVTQLATALMNRGRADEDWSCFITLYEELSETRLS